jgi:hypothetical protein
METLKTHHKLRVRSDVCENSGETSTSLIEWCVTTVNSEESFGSQQTGLIVCGAASEFGDEYGLADPTLANEQCVGVLTAVECTGERIEQSFRNRFAIEWRRGSEVGPPRLPRQILRRRDLRRE